MFVLFQTPAAFVRLLAQIRTFHVVCVIYFFNLRQSVDWQRVTWFTPEAARPNSATARITHPPHLHRSRPLRVSTTTSNWIQQPTWSNDSNGQFQEALDAPIVIRPGVDNGDPLPEQLSANGIMMSLRTVPRIDCNKALQLTVPLPYLMTGVAVNSQHVEFVETDEGVAGDVVRVVHRDLDYLFLQVRS